MEYQCSKCLHTYRDNYDLQRHINRKFPCTTVNHGKSFLNQLESPQIAGHTKTTTKVIEIVKNQCYHCKKIFSTNSNYHRHIRDYCKIKRKQENEKEQIFKELLFEVKALKKSNEELQNEIRNNKSNQTINNNTNNINNGTINQFNILAFGKEDTSHITNKEWNRIINRQYKSIEELVVKTHFDNNKPENHNIYISNIKSKYIMVYDGKTWCIKDKKDTIDELYDEKAYIILNKVDELKGLSKLPFKIVDKYNEIKTGYDEEEIRAALIKDLELVLYNKRDIPIYTKKNLENNNN